MMEHRDIPRAIYCMLTGSGLGSYEAGRGLIGSCLSVTRVIAVLKEDEERTELCIQKGSPPRIGGVYFPKVFLPQRVFLSSDENQTFFRIVASDGQISLEFERNLNLFEGNALRQNDGEIFFVLEQVTKLLREQFHLLLSLSMLSRRLGEVSRLA